MFYENEEQLQAHATSLNECLGEYDMRINIGKTETKCVSRIRSQLNIIVNGAQVKQVEEFKYLGSIFTEDGRVNIFIES